MKDEELEELKSEIKLMKEVIVALAKNYCYCKFQLLLSREK